MEINMLTSFFTIIWIITLHLESFQMHNNCQGMCVVCAELFGQARYEQLKIDRQSSKPGNEKPDKAPSPVKNGIDSSDNRTNQVKKDSSTKHDVSSTREDKIEPKPNAKGTVDGLHLPDVPDIGDLFDRAPEKEPPSQTKTSMTATDLYSVIKSSSLESVLVIDIRPPAEYSSSRIKDLPYINIPDPLLRPGASVNSIERRLPRDVWEVWVTRTQRDHIIIIDHDSEAKDLHANHPAQILKDAIFKWDSQNVLKTEPVLLEGGFKNWLLYYPSLCTNPHYSKPKSTASPFQTRKLPTLPLELDYPTLPGQEGGGIQSDIPGINNTAAPDANSTASISKKDSTVIIPDQKPTVLKGNDPSTTNAQPINSPTNAQPPETNGTDSLFAKLRSQLEDEGQRRAQDTVQPKTGSFSSAVNDRATGNNPFSLTTEITKPFKPDEKSNASPNTIRNGPSMDTPTTPTLPTSSSGTVPGSTMPEIQRHLKPKTETLSNTLRTDQQSDNLGNTTFKTSLLPGATTAAASSPSTSQNDVSSQQSFVPGNRSQPLQPQAGPSTYPSQPQLGPSPLSSQPPTGTLPQLPQPPTGRSPQLPQPPTGPSPQLPQPPIGSLPHSVQPPAGSSSRASQSSVGPSPLVSAQSINPPASNVTNNVPRHQASVSPSSLPSVGRPEIPTSGASSTSSQNNSNSHPPLLPNGHPASLPNAGKVNVQSKTPANYVAPSSSGAGFVPPVNNIMNLPGAKHSPSPKGPSSHVPTNVQPNPAVTATRASPDGHNLHPGESVTPKGPSSMIPPSGQPHQTVTAIETKLPGHSLPAGGMAIPNDMKPSGPASLPPTVIAQVPHVPAASSKEAQLPKATTQVSEKPSLPTTPGLPYGWEKAIDAKTGRVYYRDHSTKSTHWTLPPSFYDERTVEEQVEKPEEKREDYQPPKAETKSKLKRSLSTPNLADMDEIKKAAEPVEPVKPVKPVVDRTSKPVEQKRQIVDRSTKPLTASRLQALSPVYGAKGKALTGLKNLGNTCYMNSIIQCLSCTIPLGKYFHTGEYQMHINSRSMNRRPGELVRELAFLLKVLWSGEYRSVSPVDFKAMVGRFAPQFAGTSQQDAHELLMYFLDGIHEDVNKISRKTPIKEQNNDNVPDAVAANNAWSDYFKNNNSIAVDLFQGQFRSTVVCQTCGKKSVTFDVFTCLPLQLTSKNSCSVEDCIRSFSRPEKIGGNDSWKCSKCKVYREATKTIEIWKLPPVLIIQLKRFSFDGRFHNKLQTSVQFPTQDFAVGRHTVGSQAMSSYNLYAVVNHYGSFECGHYTAYCQNAYQNNKWYCYDDNVVRDIDRSSIKTSAAYLLFYTAVDFRAYTGK